MIFVPIQVSSSEFVACFSGILLMIVSTYTKRLKTFGSISAPAFIEKEQRILACSDVCREGDMIIAPKSNTSTCKLNNSDILNITIIQIK